MARKKSNWWVWCLLIIAAVVSAFFGYQWWSGRETEAPTPQEQEQEEAASEFEVLSADIEWAEDSMTIDLEKGVIKTNKQVDAVFVNIQGVGTQYLEFTTCEACADGTSTYIAEIEPTNSLCSTAFASDATVKIDVYVEYDGRAYKANVQEIDVVSCWIGPY